MSLRSTMSSVVAARCGCYESGGRTLCLGMNAFENNGCETLEEAVLGDIPPQFATILGSLVSGDAATVWLLTNDQAPFEAYEVYCERRNDLWYWDGGTGGFGVGTPDEVFVEARRLGWS